MVIIVAVLICQHVWADEIFLSDGQRYSGAITDQDEESITFKTNEGTIFLKKSEVVHIEKSATDIASGEDDISLLSAPVEYFNKIKRNNWYVPRMHCARIHNRIFHKLNKMSLYQFISMRPTIQNFRKQFPNYYFFAVYTVLFIGCVIVLSLIKNIIVMFIRKIFNVKQRYDV